MPKAATTTTPNDPVVDLLRGRVSRLPPHLLGNSTRVRALFEAVSLGVPRQDLEDFTGGLVNHNTVQNVRGSTGIKYLGLKDRAKLLLLRGFASKVNETLRITGNEAETRKLIPNIFMDSNLPKFFAAIAIPALQLRCGETLLSSEQIAAQLTASGQPVTGQHIREVLKPIWNASPLLSRLIGPDSMLAPNPAKIVESKTDLYKARLERLGSQLAANPERFHKSALLIDPGSIVADFSVKMFSQLFKVAFCGNLHLCSKETQRAYDLIMRKLGYSPKRFMRELALGIADKRLAEISEAWHCPLTFEKLAARRPVDNPSLLCVALKAFVSFETRENISELIGKSEKYVGSLSSEFADEIQLWKSKRGRQVMGLLNQPWLNQWIDEPCKTLVYARTVDLKTSQEIADAFGEAQAKVHACLQKIRAMLPNIRAFMPFYSGGSER